MTKEEYKYRVEQDGIIKMQTNEDSCIYTKAIRDQMRKAGCKIYKDGKVWKD